MKLRTVVLRNFRGYRDEVRIPIDDLTAFVGKNDVGKSTILEALDIFFGGGVVKLDPLDRCVLGEQGDSKVMIGCEFEDLPSSLVLDEAASTTLSAEFLLNSNQNLEIHKVYDLSVAKVKLEVFCLAEHPEEELLGLKISELKKLATETGVTGINRTIKAELRQAIWAQKQPLRLSLRRIAIGASEDAKSIWDK